MFSDIDDFFEVKYLCLYLVKKIRDVGKVFRIDR